VPPCGQLLGQRGWSCPSAGPGDRFRLPGCFRL